jgi:hypothetical protein
VRYSDGQVIETEQATRDMLTTWYYLRSLPLAPGDTVRFPVHVDRRNYALVAAVRGSKPVKTPAGTFDCISVLPRAAGPLGTVYLSSDSARVPVLIRTRIGGLGVSAWLRTVSSQEEP